MAVYLEIDVGLLRTALEKELASQKRLKNTTKQPEFIPIVEGVINKYMHGIASIREEPVSAGKAK